MTTALYRRYRPETFADVIGQEHVTEPLMQALRNDRITHAYLFSGPRGCGKTTSARILARCLNCADGPTDVPCGVCDSCVELARNGSGSLDVVEIDAASHNGVDDARDLRERAAFAPARDRFKIFILDEAHMVTPQGFNALLKIVEEPPPHVKFIFATTEPDKVIGTIRSRTHHYPFRLVPPETLQAYMATLCDQEKISVGQGVLPLVVRAGAGSVRDSLSVLDQLIAGSDESGLDYERAVALLGYTHASLLDDVVEALAAGDGGSVFRVVDRVIESGHDPRRFVEDLLERLRDLIVLAALDGAVEGVLRGIPEDQLARMRTQAKNFGTAELSVAADVVNRGLTEMLGATSPRLHLELMCARMLLPGAESGLNAVAARVDRLERSGVSVGVPAGSPAAVVRPDVVEVAHGVTVSHEGDARESVSAPRASGAAAGAAAARAALAAAKSGMAAGAPAAVPAAEPVVDVATPEAEPVVEQGINASDSSPEAATPAATIAAEPAESVDVIEESPTEPVADVADEGLVFDEVAAEVAEIETPVEAVDSDPVVEPESVPVVSEDEVASEPAQAHTAQVQAPAQESAAQPEPASAPASGGVINGLDASELRRRWPEVLETLSGLRKVTWTLISQNAQIGGIQDGAVVLMFATSALATTFRNGPHGELVQQALRETLGVTANITTAIDESGGAQAASGWSGHDDPHLPNEPHDDGSSSFNDRSAARPAAAGRAESTQRPEATQQTAQRLEPIRSSEPTPRSVPVERSESAAHAQPVSSSAQQQTPPSVPPAAAAPSNMDAWHAPVKLPGDDGGSRPVSQPSPSAPAASSQPASQGHAASARAAATAAAAAAAQRSGHSSVPPHGSASSAGSSQGDSSSAVPQRIAPEDDTPSADDENIESSGLIGAPLVAQMLGGTVIDEIPLNG